MDKNFRYTLEKGSKKHLCPHCGKKSFVRYVDTAENKYLPEQYGRCDHESSCAYFMLPPNETRCFYVPFINLVAYSNKAYMLVNNHGKYYIPKSQVYEVTDSGCYISEFILNRGGKKSPHYILNDSKLYSQSGTITVRDFNNSVAHPPKPCYFFPEEILSATLNNYEINTFIQNILKYAPAQDVEKVISLYRLGTIGQGPRTRAVTFPFIDILGNIRTIQAKQFDYSNHTISTDFLHSIIARQYTAEVKQFPPWLQNYLSNEKFVTCLFGEHLLNKFPANPVALVEAPKTAIIGTLFYGLPESPSNLLWLAVYNKSSLTYDKCQALKGRKVVLYPDLNAYDEWYKKTQDLAAKLPGTRFIVSDILEKHASETDRKQSLDLADYLTNFPFFHFKCQRPDSAPIKSSDPIPDYITAQALLPSTPSIPINENSEYSEAIKQSFFSEATIENHSNIDNQLAAWSTEIQSLESFFASTPLPQTPLRLDSCTTINDLPQFISGHLSSLYTYKGLNTVLPYLNRLYQLQQIFLSINT